MKPAEQAPTATDPTTNAPIVAHDPRLKRNFVMLPHEVMDMPGLSRDAKMTYCYLLRYAWEDANCFPGRERLQADLGATVKSVSGYLHELELHRLIRIERRGNAKTNVYHLLPLAEAGLSPLAVVPQPRTTTGTHVGADDLKGKNYPSGLKGKNYPSDLKGKNYPSGKVKITSLIRKTKTQSTKRSTAKAVGADAPPIGPPVQDEAWGDDKIQRILFDIAEAIIKARGSTVMVEKNAGRFNRLMGDVNQHIVTAFRADERTITRAKVLACLAYVRTMPRMEANPTLISAKIVSEELGPWLEKGMPAQYQAAPSGGASKPVPSASWRSDIDREIAARTPTATTNAEFDRLTGRTPRAAPGTPS